MQLFKILPLTSGCFANPEDIPEKDSCMNGQLTFIRIKSTF
jgi:hypothetical protein